MDSLDWNLLRSFVAVAEQGSLSSAARALGLSQPTLSRHVTELADQLSVTLFVRHPRGLDLTARGAELYELARRIGEGVDRFTRQATGMSEVVAGTVRISASEVATDFVLPPLLAGLRREHPNIELEVVADNRVANLLRRDADIAVRMFRPEQLDLIARKIAESPLALYASVEYLAAHGEPRGLGELEGHTFLGFDRDTLHLRVLDAIGSPLRRDDFQVRSDAQTFHVHAVAAGVGIGGVQVAVAQRLGGLVRVLPEIELPPLPIWLVAHQDLRRSLRVRIVYDALAAGLQRFFAPRDDD